MPAWVLCLSARLRILLSSLSLLPISELIKLRRVRLIKKTGKETEVNIFRELNEIKAINKNQVLNGTPLANTTIAAKNKKE